MNKIDLPTYETLMNPTLQALRALGGSGTIEELDNKVFEMAGISDEEVDIPHDPVKGGKSEIEYRLAWTRTYLKKYGLLENSARGVWALTQNGRQTDRVNPKDVSRYFREQKRLEKQEEIEDYEETEVELPWRDDLLATLQKMDPSAFERLIQRLLKSQASFR